MLGYLIMLVITGLVVGALARLALPGRDPMSLLQTMLVGIAGSTIAGLLFWAITDERNGVGILPAVLVSTGIVYLIRRSRGGSLREPAPVDRLGGDRPQAR